MYLNEDSLKSGDLRDLVSHIFEVDCYKSKMGEDKDVVVLSFTVESRSPAEDLVSFIEKGYQFVLDADLNLNHRVTAIFGPSGSGKSTLLSIIAGITPPDSGRIVIDGECIFDQQSRINKPMHQRKIGLVFQDSRLFPHLTVEGNLKYGLQFLRNNHANT